VELTGVRKSARGIAEVEARNSHFDLNWGGTVKEFRSGKELQLKQSGHGISVEGRDKYDKEKAFWES